MKKQSDIIYGILFLLVLILLVRLVSLGLYPLMDTTEARYGEMARKILETHNWLTPQYDYGVPFWGKPPFSFWASAVTMAIFGINEFGARLAPFIASILTGLLFFTWPYSSNSKENKKKALGSFVISISALIGFVSAGAVMTDEFLFLSVTLSMIAFWKAVSEENSKKIWGYTFFVGLSLGLLSINALSASNSALIPVQCEYFAMEGLAQVLSIIKRVQSSFNRDLEIEGFLLTMYETRSTLGKEIVSQVRGLFRENTFNVEIPRNISISESSGKGIPVNLYKPTSAGARAYMQLAKEILENESRRKEEWNCSK